MATGAALSSTLDKISKRHLQCSICHERYRNPKVLDCIHSFCQQCLENYQRTRYMGAPAIPCPLCRKETVLPERGIVGLKANFPLSGMVEEISQQDRVRRSPSDGAQAVCQICDEGKDALHRCLDCQRNICSTCRELHARIPALSDHLIASLEDICRGKVAVRKTSKDGSGGTQCPKHKGEVMRFYCETCGQSICRDCTVLDHPKPRHRYVDSDKACLKRKEALMTNIFPVIAADVNRLEESYSVTTQAKLEFERKAHLTMKSVQNRADTIRATVTSQENQILDKIKTLLRDRNRAFEDHATSLANLLKRKQHALKTAHDIADTASDGDFLHVYHALRSELEALHAQTLAQIDLKYSYLRYFTPRGDMASVGRLETESARWEMCREFGKRGQGELEFKGANGVAALPNDEIAVADCFNQQLVIFGMDGQNKGNIPIEGYSNNIAAIQDQLAVVDDTPVAKIYPTSIPAYAANSSSRPDFKCFFTAPRPWNKPGKLEMDLQSVAVTRDGTVLVGDVKRSVLTEHRCVNDYPLVRTVSVKTRPHYLAVDGSTGRIAVSGHDGQRVDIADGDGATIATIRPTIGGQRVRYCNGVCCDDRGALYVAVHNDEDPGHVHSYDMMDGRFLGCVAQGLRSPKGIAFTPDGKLAVADWFSVKLYHKI